MNINHARGRHGIWRPLAAVWLAGIAVLAPMAKAQTELLLADTTRRPRVTVSWPTSKGQTTTLQGDRGYESPGQKSLLGKNVEAYVALGGTRLDKGAGHPRGAVVRVGLYKLDAKKLFFDDIAETGIVTIKLEGIFMNQPAVPRPKTGLMHLKYILNDLQDCGLDGNDRNLLITVEPDDPVKAVTLADSGRWGGLDGKGDQHGSLTAAVQPDGSVSMVCTFPYPVLRHLKDPYQRSKPGAFFEPQHFHIEIELLPTAVAEPAAPNQPAKPAAPSTAPSPTPPQSEPQAAPEPAKPRD